MEYTNIFGSNKSSKPIDLNSLGEVVVALARRGNLEFQLKGAIANLNLLRGYTSSSYSRITRDIDMNLVSVSEDIIKKEFESSVDEVFGGSSTAVINRNANGNIRCSISIGRWLMQDNFSVDMNTNSFFPTNEVVTISGFQVNIQPILTTILDKLYVCSSHKPFLRSKDSLDLYYMLSLITISSEEFNNAVLDYRHSFGDFDAFATGSNFRDAYSKLKVHEGKIDVEIVIKTILDFASGIGKTNHVWRGGELKWLYLKK